MLIVNGGIPRSGTVLVGNLLRLMLERRGVSWRRYNPQERRHLPDFLRLAESQFPGTVIVHTHLIDTEILAALRNRDDALLIWNHRDPRDALVSLMQLHDLTLQRGIEALQVYCTATEKAHASPDCLKFRYEALVTDLPSHILKLASVLHFELEDGEVDALVCQTSTKAHARIMDDLQRGTRQGGLQIATKTRMLREDPMTLVNDRHIQSGKAGRWLSELPAAAQDQANRELSRWIRSLGYADVNPAQE